MSDLAMQLSVVFLIVIVGAAIFFLLICLSSSKNLNRKFAVTSQPLKKTTADIGRELEISEIGFGL